MKNIKFLIVAFGMTLASVSWAKTVVDKMVLNELDAHKTGANTLTLPAGHSKITVESDDKKVLISCKFINSNGVVGLEQDNVEKCEGNIKLESEDTLKVQVTNELDSYLDYRIHQVTTSDDK